MIQLKVLRLQMNCLCLDIADSSQHEEYRTSISMSCIGHQYRNDHQECRRATRHFDLSKHPQNIQDQTKQLLEAFVTADHRGPISCLELNASISANRPNKKSYLVVVRKGVNPVRVARFPYGADNSDSPQGFLRKRDKNGDDIGICGSQHDLIDSIEELPWVETVQECRFPLPYYQKESRLSGLALKQTGIVAGRQEGMTGGVSERMEKNSGRRLLWMQESSDLEVVGWVERDMTAAEA
jgi:hypothetical protein